MNRFKIAWHVLRHGSKILPMVLRRVEDRPQYVVRYPLGRTTFEGYEMDNCDIATEILRRVREGADVALPLRMLPGEEWSIRPLDGGGTRPPTDHELETIIAQDPRIVSASAILEDGTSVEKDEDGYTVRRSGHEAAARCVDNPRPESCPHAGPHRFCQQCKVTPCPLGFDPEPKP